MARRIASNFGLQRLLVGVALGACFGARAAHAEGTDPSFAQQLFDEARALMKQGDYVTACSKLTQSQALDPGGGTLLNLGICHAKQGRTATAFAELNLALAQAKREGRADRERTAQRHLDELTPVLSHLTLLVQPGASADGLVVELDGSPVEPTRLGSPIVVDPGAHQIRALQQAHKPWSAAVSIAPGRDQLSVEIPVLAPDAPSPAPLGAVAPVQRAPATALVAPGVAVNPVAPRGPTALRAETGTPRWIGVATLGFGAAAIGVGSYFGIRALDLKSESNQGFNGSKCIRQSCLDDWRSAQRAAVYSDVAFGVGLAALGVGTYLVLAPRKQQRATQGPTLLFAGTRSGATLSAKTEF